MKELIPTDRETYEKNKRKRKDSSMYESIWGGYGGTWDCEHKITSCGLDGYKCKKCGKRWV